MNHSNEYLLDKIAFLAKRIDKLKALLDAERAGRIAELKNDIDRMESELMIMEDK